MSYHHSLTGEAMTAVKNALDSAQVISDKIEKAKARYSPQIFEEHRREYMSEYESTLSDARAAVEKARAAAHERLNKEEIAMLSVGDAEEDFKLLSLPVTLTEHELLVLASKHPGNAMFGRAIAQYAENHKYDDKRLRILGQQFANVSVTRSLVDDMYNRIVSYVSDRNPSQAQSYKHRIERMEAEGLFDKL